MPIESRSDRVAVLAGVLVTALSLGSNIVRADTLIPVAPLGTLSLSSSWAATAAGQSPATVTGTGVNNNTLPVLVNDMLANASSTYFFNDSFSNPTGSYPDVSIVDATQGAEGIGFIDSYVFAVPASSTNAFAFSLNLSSVLGLQNLTARLYAYNAGGNQNLTVGGTGPIASGLMANWSQSSNPTGNVAVASTALPTSSLDSGEYVLEVAGLEVGGVSGSYSGQLNISPDPVPLPAALPLLLSGMAGIAALGAVGRRRTV